MRVCVFVAEPLFPFSTHKTAPAPIWNIHPKRDVAIEREARERELMARRGKDFRHPLTSLPTSFRPKQTWSCGMMCKDSRVACLSVPNWLQPCNDLCQSPAQERKVGGFSLPEPVWEKCEEKKTFAKKKENEAIQTEANIWRALTVANLTLKLCCWVQKTPRK